MNKKLILLLLLGAMSTTLMAQRHTDKLDRGLVVVQAGSAGNSKWNRVTWRRLSTEYYNVKYNLYKDGVKYASNLETTNFYDEKNGLPSSQYQVAAVVNGVEQAKCDPMKAWAQWIP